jgi:hypothetical protein
MKARRLPKCFTTYPRRVNSGQKMAEWDRKLWSGIASYRGWVFKLSEGDRKLFSCSGEWDRKLPRVGSQATLTSGNRWYEWVSGVYRKSRKSF